MKKRATRGIDGVACKPSPCLGIQLYSNSQSSPPEQGLVYVGSAWREGPSGNTQSKQTWVACGWKLPRKHARWISLFWEEGFLLSSAFAPKLKV